MAGEKQRIFQKSECKAGQVVEFMVANIGNRFLSLNSLAPLDETILLNWNFCRFVMVILCYVVLKMFCCEGHYAFIGTVWNVRCLVRALCSSLCDLDLCFVRESAFFWNIYILSRGKIRVGVYCEIRRGSSLVGQPKVSFVYFCLYLSLASL